MTFLSCIGAKRRFKKSAPKTLKSSRCRWWLILLQRRPVIDWPWSTLPQSFKLNLIIFCKDCNWLAYVTSPADWCESDGRSLIITRVVFNLANLPIHESTLSSYLSRWGFLNYSSPAAAANISWAWESLQRGVETLLWNGKCFHENNSTFGSVCEESNYVPHYRVAGTGGGGFKIIGVH